MSIKGSIHTIISAFSDVDDCIICILKIITIDLQLPKSKNKSGQDLRQCTWWIMRTFHFLQHGRRQILLLDFMKSNCGQQVSSRRQVTDCCTTSFHEVKQMKSDFSHTSFIQRDEINLWQMIVTYSVGLQFSSSSLCGSLLPHYALHILPVRPSVCPVPCNVNSKTEKLYNV